MFDTRWLSKELECDTKLFYLLFDSPDIEIGTCGGYIQDGGAASENCIYYGSVQANISGIGICANLQYRMTRECKEWTSLVLSFRPRCAEVTIYLGRYLHLQNGRTAVKGETATQHNTSPKSLYKTVATSKSYTLTK